MATTSNFGWPTPDDTDLVRDGADAIRGLGDAIDTTVADKAPLLSTENVQTGNYTLALSDVAKVVAINSGSTATVTVPSDSSVAFPVGTVINVYRAGTGDVEIEGAAGVTVRNVGSISDQYGEVSLRKRDTDEWVLLDQTQRLVAVKSALKTDTQEEIGVTKGDSFAVTGLSITHEVADASNRLIISAFFGAAATNHGEGNVGIAVHDGTSLIAIGDADEIRTRVTAGGYVSAGISNAVVTMPSVTFVHTPGAGSKTYTVHAINIRSVTHTLYINRMQSDLNSENYLRAASSLVIQEVSV